VGKRKKSTLDRNDKVIVQNFGSHKRLFAWLRGRNWFKNHSLKINIKAAGALRASARGTVSVISTFSAADRLFTTARMSADVVTRTVLSETLQGSIYGQKNTPAALTVRDVLAARAQGSKNIPAPLELADRLTAAAAGSKNVTASLKVSEVLTSMLEATSQTTERTTLQLTIPPGGELRIDSELFLVLLNGENALHTQSGDWINVSRELLRLIIESASGGQLRGQLIYTERYL